MTQPEPYVVEQPLREPTLAAVLTRAVRTAVPTRLYQLLHLALPLAVDFGFRGWWRPAIAAIAVVAFGAWGLADRWISGLADDDTPRSSWSIRLCRVSRVITGTAAATAAALLLLEAFLRLLGAAPIS